MITLQISSRHVSDKLEDLPCKIHFKNSIQLFSLEDIFKTKTILYELS